METSRSGQKSVIAGAVFLPRGIIKKQVNTSMEQSIIQNLLTQRDEDSNKPQKIKCLNDKLKLTYDRDSFMRFYKLKQALQSQNIMFNELQQTQSLNKGAQTHKVDNQQDFFVNARRIYSND